jgi:hypothetical protein
MVEDDARLSVEPAAIVPVLDELPLGLRVTVLPLDVVAVLGRVVVVVVRVVVVVFGVVVVVFGVVVFVDVPEVVAVVAGTSESAGCAVVSPFASWMSLFNAESADAVLSFFAHAPANSAIERTSDALSRGIY